MLFFGVNRLLCYFADYIGCFVDQLFPRDLETAGLYRGATVESCRRACTNKKTAYFGLQVNSSVARWLSPKPAKWSHEKQLDPAENLVTNCQLKSDKNNEILLKNLLFLRCVK